MLKLPPGKYFIGDPCYVFQDPTWQQLLDSSDFFQDEDIVTFQDKELFAASTAFGDGTYTDQNGVEYGVDSGMLGAIPIELIDNPEGEEHGTVVDAPNGLKIEYDEGVFWFGAICINTKGDTDDEYDDPYGDGVDEL